MEILKKAAPLPGLFSRRGFLTGVGATLVYSSVAEFAWPRSASAQRLGDDPFTLGVASGDPTADGVVLWTRLALKPLEGNGGMPDRPVAVQWRIAATSRCGGSSIAARSGRCPRSAIRCTSRCRD